LVDLIILILIFNLTDNGWSVFALCILFSLSFGAGARLVILSRNLACSFHLVRIRICGVNYELEFLMSRS